MSFRLKTILGIALIEAVLLFILILSSMTFLRTSNEQELQKRAYTLARVFATTTQDAVLSTNLASLESAIQQALTNPNVVYVRIRGRQDVVLAEGGDPERLKQPFHADMDIDDIQDGVFDADADITIAATQYGRVEIGLSTDSLEGVLASARRQMGIIAVVEMSLVALFSFVLGLYLTRGLDRLRDASRRLAAGELGFTIPVKGRDELAQTAITFNEMSGKLRSYYEQREQAEEALNRLNEDLEQRVHLRTEELTQAYAQIEHQAMHDALTRLPNRTLFHDRLKQAILFSIRENKPFGLVIIDLNHFKEINDSLGHHAGDLVLQEAADRLRGALRQSDTVARLGGDEFALILPTVGDPSNAVVILNKLHQVLEAPMTIDGQELTFGGSLGMALFPHDGNEASQLMRRADMAMYAAKRRKEHHVLYTGDLEQVTTDRLNMQTELRRAIQNNELVLYYQPKVDFTSGVVNGVEALVRWQHPKRGLMFPDDFLPLAEQSGLIKPLTEWVLNDALRQCRLWLNEGLALQVAVNVSVTDIQDLAFADTVAESLARAGVEAELLELEITETGIMVEPKRAIAVITRLSEMGVQVAIDDFGTGYSSMAYLRKLPIARIKVDKSFVRDMLNNKNDDVIVRTIIGLGHNLGLSVVAEGVENKEIWARLRTLDCDSAQGYGLSRPIPADQLERWVAESPYGLKHAGNSFKLKDAT